MTAIDRHEVENLLNEIWDDTKPIAHSIDEWVDRILALVQPAEGVHLTPEEAQRLIGWYAALPIGVTSEDVELANRLKGLSE